MLVIFGLILLIIELYAWIPKLNERGRVLAQEIALLRDSLDRELAHRNDVSHS